MVFVEQYVYLQLLLVYLVVVLFDFFFDQSKDFQNVLLGMI